MKRGFQRGWTRGLGLDWLRLLASWAIAAASVQAGDQIRVQVQNLAGVSESTLSELRVTVEHTYRVADITITWDTPDGNQPLVSTAPDGQTSPRPERRFHLRLVTARLSFSQNPQCLGEAIVEDGGGTLAIVYVDRVRVYAANHRLPVGRVLGYAAAHEMGHLLLGSTAHSDDGLMRPGWDRYDAEAMRRRQLDVSESLARQFARGTSLRVSASALASHAQTPTDRRDPQDELRGDAAAPES